MVNWLHFSFNTKINTTIKLELSSSSVLLTRNQSLAKTGMKSVLIFAASVKICSGCAVQDSEVPKYSQTVTADGGWAGHPCPDIFQQAGDAAAPSRGGESDFWCTLVAPILVLQRGGGGELQLTWKRSLGEDKEVRGWGGAAETAEQRNGNLQWGLKVCRERRQQLVQEKVQNESAEERWHWEESKKLKWNLHFSVIIMNHKKTSWASPRSSQITSWLISLLP